MDMKTIPPELNIDDGRPRNRAEWRAAWRRHPWHRRVDFQEWRAIFRNTRQARS